MSADLQAVFLDRDGTLSVGPPPGEYVTDPADLRLVPHAGRLVRTLNESGVKALLVTNQRGVARGIMSEDDLARVHERLAALLRAHDAYLDGIYVCTHEKDVCDCRKPRTGMIKQALRDHPAIDPSRCLIVGDSDTDIELGRALGIQTVRVGADGERAVPATYAVPHLGVMLDRLPYLAGSSRRP